MAAKGNQEGPYCSFYAGIMRGHGPGYAAREQRRPAGRGGQVPGHYQLLQPADYTFIYGCFQAAMACGGFKWTDPYDWKKKGAGLSTDLLGTGAFCHIYRGKYRRTEEDVYEVAVIVCHEGKLAMETNEESKEARKAMISEAQAMAQYVHECIITLHGVAMSHPPILIMEYRGGGNRLISSKGTIKISDFGLSTLVEDVYR